MKYNSGSIKETQKIAQEIVDNLKSQNVILLQGELGAGKTTFCQSVLNHFGAVGPFTSPTFVIMKKYEIDKLQIQNSKSQINSKSKIQNLKFCSIYHFDCYRVNEKDVLDLGWEEIISNPNNLVLVEWPEKIKNILPKKNMKIVFGIIGEKKREVVVMV